MGLDSNAKFFYGMPLGAAYHLLQTRGQENGKSRCQVCGKVVDSKFCPDDGGSTEPIETKVDLQDLCEGTYGAAKELMQGLELLALDHENEDSYFIVIAESVKEAGDLRGDGAGATALGKFPGPPEGTHLGDWDDRIKALCAAIEIKYFEPEFFFGLYLSY
jgi:hypothetical protein